MKFTAKQIAYLENNIVMVDLDIISLHSNIQGNLVGNVGGDVWGGVEGNVKGYVLGVVEGGVLGRCGEQLIVRGD